MRGWRNTVGNLIEIVWLKKAFHRPRFTGMRMNNGGVRFRRSRDLERYYFDGVPPTSHYIIVRKSNYQGAMGMTRNAHLHVIRPIPLVSWSLLGLFDSNFLGNPLWTWEFHPLNLRLCWSQTLWNPESLKSRIFRKGHGRLELHLNNPVIILKLLNNIIIDYYKLTSK